MEYNFLKTGQNQYNEEEKISDEMIQFMMANIRVYIEEAIQYASRYVIHCGRQVVTKTDIFKSLQTVALQDRDFWEKKETKQKTQDYFWEEDEGSDDSDSEDMRENMDNALNSSDTSIDESVRERICATTKAVFPHLRNAGYSPNDAALKCIEIAKFGIDAGDAYTESQCPCRICTSILSADEKWQEWIPATDQGQYIYSALEKTMEKFKE